MTSLIPTNSLRVIPRVCLAPITELLFVHDASNLLAGQAAQQIALAGLCSSCFLIVLFCPLLLGLSSRLACGPNLALYELASGRVLDECVVFDGQRIHGVQLTQFHGHQLLCLFGGKFISILELRQPTQVTAANTQQPCQYFGRLWSSPIRSDLIWNVKLLECSSGCSVNASTSSNTFDLAIGYAHDRIEFLSFTVDDTSASLKLSLTNTNHTQFQCEDRSLLYSMCLHGRCRHSLLVVGGTVFSHILVWDASCSNESSPQIPASSAASPTQIVTRQIVHRITGHEGVLFRVETNSNATRICSVSDDRTVRVWQWTPNSITPSTSTTSTNASSQPVALTSLLDSSLASYHPLFESYGHKARVWRCKFLEDYPFIVSSSEDNSCLVWHGESGELITKFSGQKGGLWALDVNEKKRLIATGGGDSSIRIWSLDAILKREGLLKREDGETGGSGITDVQTICANMSQLLPPLIDTPEVSHTPVSEGNYPPPQPKQSQTDADALTNTSALAKSDKAVTVDKVIIRSITLLDELDKDVNTFGTRIREWYGWHFPEMYQIVTDNILYAKVILKMGFRSQAQETDFSQLLSEEMARDLKEAAEVSMGAEITEADLENIRQLCEQVISMSEQRYRASLLENLPNRMKTVAPNLSKEVGELVDARLIAHGGSLTNLAKFPASTPPSVTAEEQTTPRFRAMKSKHPPPKYGLHFHQPFLQTQPPKTEGRIARYLANKAALQATGSSDSTTAASSSTSAASIAPFPTPDVALSEPVKTKAKKVVVEYCRELLLDVIDAHHSRIYFVTNFGRVACTDIQSNQKDLPPHQSVQPFRTHTTVLYLHTQSTTAIVTLSLSPCKNFLALGDQRGSLLVLSGIPSSLPSAAPTISHLWQTPLHAAALVFIRWMPTQTKNVSATSTSLASYQLLTGDAVNEMKLWQFHQIFSSASSSTSASTPTSSMMQLSPLLNFRLPVSKARVTCAIAITTEEIQELTKLDATMPIVALEESSSSEDEDEDEEDDTKIASRLSDLSLSSNSSNIAGTFFICGDSRGSVYVYFISSSVNSSTSKSTSASNPSSSTPTIFAVDRQLNVHDKAPLTSLSLAPHHTSSGTKFYSTANDGRVIEYALTARGGNLAKAFLTQQWIEKHNQSQSILDQTPVNQWQLAKKRVHKLPQIGLIQQVFFASPATTDSTQRDVFITGFHANEFIVWNLTQNTPFRRWACGGDKRPWAFRFLQPLIPSSSSASPHLPQAIEDGFIFCYARHGEEKLDGNSGKGKSATAISSSSVSSGGELLLHCQPASVRTQASTALAGSAVPNLGCSIHGRLTTSLGTISLQPNASLVLTSSEDNTIKVFSVLTPPTPPPAQPIQSLSSALPYRSSISCVATLVEHPDVVRALAISNESFSVTEASTSSSSLVFSGGGRDFLHCSRIHATTATTSTSSNSPHPIAVTIEGLGSVGGAVFQGFDNANFTHSQQKIEIEKERLLKQDLRIMCLTAVPIPQSWIKINSGLSSSFHFVVSGNSIGVVKFYLFDSTRMKFHLLSESPHHGYTILSLAHLLIGDELFIFSGATDGRIMIWSVKDMIETYGRKLNELPSTVSPPAITPPLSPIFSHLAHQSGVDCLFAASLVPDQIHLFSGGDDEAIFVLTARLDSLTPKINALSLSDGSTSTSPLSSVWYHLYPNMHSSAVKSLTMFNQRLYSVGYDQRLRVFQLESTVLDSTQIKLGLKVLGVCPLDIWDVSSIRAIAPNRSSSSSVAHPAASNLSPFLVIGGQGMQVVQLQSTTD